MDPYTKFVAARMAAAAPGTPGSDYAGPVSASDVSAGQLIGIRQDRAAAQAQVAAAYTAQQQALAAAAVQAAYANAPVQTVTPPVVLSHPAALATGFGGVVQPPVYKSDPFSPAQQAAFNAGAARPFGLGPQGPSPWQPVPLAAPQTGLVPYQTGSPTFAEQQAKIAGLAGQTGGEDFVGSAVNAAADPTIGAVMKALPYIDKPRQISVSQMGELIHAAANGQTQVPFQLAGIPGGPAYWEVIKKAVAGDKGIINQLYNQGAEMGGGQMIDPATGQMKAVQGQHITGGRAVYEKYVAAASDNWPVYLRLPFRLMFDVVADPTTYVLPGATEVGQAALKKGGQLVEQHAAQEAAVREASAKAAEEAAAKAAATTGAEVAAKDAGAVLPTLNPAAPAEAAAKVESVLPSLNPAPAAATTTATEAEIAAARDVLAKPIGRVLQATGLALKAPQEVLDAAARIIVGLPTDIIKSLLGDLAEPTTQAIRNRISAESGAAMGDYQKGVKAMTPDPIERVMTDEGRVPVRPDVAPAPVRPETGGIVDVGGGPVVAPEPTKVWTPGEVKAEHPNWTTREAGLESNRRNAVLRGETITPPTLDEALTGQPRVETGAATDVGTAAAPTGPVVAPEPSIGATPLDQHLTPQAMQELAATPERPNWYREMTPQERSAAIKRGQINETTPIPEGQRIVDTAYRDWRLSGDPAKQAQWTAFEQQYAPLAARYNREVALVDATHYPSFEYKKALQATMEAEHVVNDVAPSYVHATGGEVPEIAITEPRAVTKSGAKASFESETDRYLVQRAVYSTDPVAAQEALDYLYKSRWQNAPWRDEMIARLQRARTQVEAIQAAQRGPVEQYVVEKQTVYAVHQNGERLKVQGFGTGKQAQAEADRLNGTIAPKVEPPTIPQTPTEAPTTTQPMQPNGPYRAEKADGVWRVVDREGSIHYAGGSQSQAERRAYMLNRRDAAMAPGGTEAAIPVEAAPSVQSVPMDPSHPSIAAPETGPTAPATPVESTPPPAGATPPATPSTPQSRTLEAVGPKRDAALFSDLTPEAASDPSLLGDMVRASHIDPGTYDLMRRPVPGMRGTTYQDIADQIMARHPFDEQAANREFSRFYVMREGPAPDPTTQFGQMWRSTMAIPKGIAQYNITNVHGIVGDMLQDGARMVFEGHGAAFASSINPVNWIKAMLDRPTVYEEIRAKLGMADPYVEGHFHRTGAATGEMKPITKALTLGGRGGKRAQLIVDILTEPLDSKALRKARNGLDALRRQAVFVDTVQKEYGGRRAAWLEQSQARLEQKGLDPAALDSLPDLFNARQAREAAAAAGADPDLAGRIARDWKAQVNAMRSAGKAESDRVLFSFEQTKADALLSNVFYYHYWMTRAYPAYASMAIRNPEFLALWYRTWMASEKQAREGGMPASFTGRLRWFGTGGGFYGSMNPWYVLAPTDPGSISGLSQNASLFDKAAQIVAFNPAISMAAAVVGLSNDAPDPLMTYSIRKYVGTIANFGRAHGWWGDTSLGDAPYQAGLANTINFVRDILSHKLHLPVTAKRLANDPNGYNEEQLAYVARTVVEEQTGVPYAQWTQKEWDLWNAANVAIKTQDPSNPIANEAFKRWTEAKGANDAGAFLSPGGSRLGYGPRDQGRALSAAGWGQVDAGAQPTPAQQGEMDFKTQAQATGEAAPLMALDTQYKALGTPWQQDLSSGWSTLAYGTPEELTAFFSPPGAKLGASYVQVGGQWISFADLAAMPADQRKTIADQWQAERTNPTTGASGTIESKQLQDQQDAFKTANPTYGAYADWKSQARKYPGGEAAWVAAARKGNPSYDAYLKASKNPDKAALSLNGYLAFNGTQSNVYAGPSPAVRDMSQVPYNPSESIGGGGQGSNGPTLSRPDQLRKSISDYNAKWAAVAKYLPNNGQGWDQIAPPVRAAYLAKLKAQGITLPSLPARVGTYYEWQALQPKGADTSPEAFFAWLDATGSTDPGTALTGVGSDALTPAA